jgi:tetratricopeptide (TPR) repeat protein
LVSARRERAFVLAAVVVLGAGPPASSREPELERARRLIEAGAKREAERVLRRLTALSPSDAPAWSLLGRLYQDSSRFAEAADALERALAIDAQDVPALTALANARVGLGRPAEALEAFERSIQANRRRSTPLASAHGSFAVFLLRLDRVAEAREQLRLARAIAADDPTAAPAERALGARSSRPWPAAAGAALGVPGDARELLRNAGRLFEDGAGPAGLAISTLPYSGWSNAIADLDNDGWKDLFSANGHALDDVERGQDRGYRQRNSVFQNMRDGTFRDVSREAGAGLQRVAPHRGAAVADFDNDGRLDIVVTALGERPSLLRNVTEARAHWLSVRLVGRASNRLRLGAVLRVETPDGRVQWNHATTSVGYASSSDPRVHFGLGAEDRVRRLEVRWPSGRRQLFEGVAADRLLELREPDQ